MSTRTDDDIQDSELQDDVDVQSVSFSDLYQHIDQNDFQSPVLYKKGQNGGLYRWQICAKGSEGLLIIIYGQEMTSKGAEGKMSIVTRKGIGKNGRSGYDQCVQECNHRVDKQKSRGYHPRGIEGGYEIPIQLAVAYKWIGMTETNGTHITSHNTNIKPDTFNNGVLVSAKVDGVRGLVYREYGNITIISRQRKPINTVDHLKEELAMFMDGYMQSECILDGEIYKHGMDFNEISGIVRRTVNASSKTKELKYYIFDVALPNIQSEERLLFLENAFSKWLEVYTPTYVDCLVSTHKAHSQDDIMAYHSHFCAMGYEGVMLRLPSSVYTNGRNKNLMKMKSTNDDEGIIVGIKEASGTEEGLAILVLYDRDGGGIFSCRPGGSFQARKSLLDTYHDVIGKPYTYRVTEITSLGMPRFPVGKGLTVALRWDI